VRANSGSRQRPSPSPSPGAQRRQELRQQRRADRLRHGWRFLVYSALAAAVGYGLMRQGWMLRNANQVEVSGSALVSREQVIEAANIRFPQPLLALQPSELSRNLSESLPVELVRVSRLMMPPPSSHRTQGPPSGCQGRAPPSWRPGPGFCRSTGRLDQ
jgi:cell division protein FtsQ